MANSNDLPPISEETVDMLEAHVKKGKARKFFLIYKGATIKTLVVFKKGPFGPKIMKAKKDGFKGDVAYGVVTGSGKNLFFQLPANGEVAAAMKVDGFEDKPPTKKAKLREFLKDAGLSFKPEYNMITDVGSAPDPESESDIPLPPPPPGSAVEDEDGAGVPPPPPPPPGTGERSPADEFAQRLKQLKPDLAKVVSAGVEASQDTKLKASEAAVFARKSEFETANQLLDEVEELIESGLQQLQRQAVEQGDPSALITGRIKKLIPKVKEAAGTPSGDEAKLKLSEAATLSRNQQFDEANQLLDAVEELLHSDGSESPTKGSDELAKKLGEALKRLRPLIEKAIQVAPNRKGELTATMGQIAGEIKSRQLDQAKQNVTDFATLLKSLVSQGGGESGGETAERLVEFQDRCGPLESRLLEAKRADPDRATKLQAAWDIAAEKANAGDFKTAFTTLDRLEQAIEGILQAPAKSDTERFGIREGIVAEQRDKLEKFFQDRVRVAAAETEVEVNKLSGAISEVPDEDSQELTAEINDALYNLFQEASDSLLEDLRSLSTQRVFDGLKKWKKTVASDPLVQHVQTTNSELGISTDVIGKFEQLFDDIENQVRREAATTS